MAINKVKPSRKETVGAQYVCFNTMTEDGEWTEEFEADVERTAVVKTIKVTENAADEAVYASGAVYDNDTAIASIDVETEVIAFPDLTLAKMRGDSVDTGGLILSGAGRQRPYFAYGKVVKLKNGKVRFEWYPKCKLMENTDDISTSEEKASEQNDTLKIKAYPFNDAGDIVAKVSSDAKMPEGLTEEKFFSKPILKKEDLTAALGA